MGSGVCKLLDEKERFSAAMASIKARWCGLEHAVESDIE